MNSTREIFIDEYLKNKSKYEVREEIFLANPQTPTGREIREYLRWSEYDLICQSCGGDLVHNDTEKEWFCPFCED